MCVASCQSKETPTNSVRFDHVYVKKFTTSILQTIAADLHVDLHIFIMNRPFLTPMINENKKKEPTLSLHFFSLLSAVLHLFVC